MFSRSYPTIGAQAAYSRFKAGAIFSSRFTAVLAGITLFGATAVLAEEANPPKITILPGSSEAPQIIEVDYDDLPTSISLDSIISNQPVAQTECTIKGPKYEWSASGTGASIPAEPDSDGDGQSDPQSGSTSLDFTATALGTYDVSANVKATYRSECGGTGTDIPLSDDAAFKIKVVDKKIWDPANEQGEEGLSGGELVKPNNKVGPLTVPIYVTEGESLDLEVAEATDSDHWKQAGKEGYEADTITYNWSASSDGVAGAFTGSAAARSTTWKAPLMDKNLKSAVVTFTCTIDDTPTAVPAEDDENSDRDDDKITRTIEVMVVQKFWDKGTPIGQDVGTTGTTVYNGRLLAPLDSTVANFKPAPVYAAPGSAVPFKVEAATDNDGWEKTPNKGVEADSLTDEDYEWSVSGGDGGGFRKQNADGSTTGPSPTLTGREVSFVAPVDATSGSTYTVTCTISNAHGKAITAPDEIINPNSRKDDPITRTQEVKISGGAASFDIVKFTAPATETEPATYASAGSTIGGSVYGALYVTAGPGMKVTSNGALARFYEKPDTANGVTHGEDESHIDVAVDFTSAEEWQKLYDPDGDGPKQEGWWASPEAPNAAASGVDGARYRRLLPWSTFQSTSGTRFDDGQSQSGKLWGHNGDHELSLRAVDSDTSAKIDFTSSYGGSSKADKPAAKNADVQNLIITSLTTSNGTSDYFKFNPNSNEQEMLHPTITFSIRDSGDKHRYKWYLWAKPTRAEQNYVEFTGIMPSDGSKSVVVNADAATQHAAGYTQSHNLTEWGTYTFELRVIETQQNSEADIGEPAVDFRSTKIDMSSHDFKYIGDDEADFKVLADYFIESDKAASDVKISFLDSNLKDKVVNASGPTEVGNHEDVEIYRMLDSDPSGIYIGVFAAADNHSELYRDHKPKRMYGINQRTATSTPFNIWEDSVTWPSLSGKGIGFSSIDGYFRNIGITPHWMGTTAGTSTTAQVGGWTCTFAPLSSTGTASQQALPGVANGENVIMMEYQGAESGREIDGTIGNFGTYLNGNWNLRPAYPGLAAISPQNIDSSYTGDGQGIGEDGTTLADGVGFLQGPLDNTQVRWIYTNTMLHELTHSLARGNHCGDWYVLGWSHDPMTPTCVLRPAPSPAWAQDLAANQTVYRHTKVGVRPIPSPWHSMWEINQMRWQLGLPSWTGIGIYTHLVRPSVMEAFR